MRYKEFVIGKIKVLVIGAIAFIFFCASILAFIDSANIEGYVLLTGAVILGGIAGYKYNKLMWKHEEHFGK